MIADASTFDDQPFEYEVRYRQGESPKRKRIVLAEKLAATGKQKLANRSRFRRGGDGKAFSGVHRRRDKRSYV